MYHEVLSRLITEEVLKEAQEELTRATQAEEEEAAAFGIRIMKSSRSCRNVLTSTALVKIYVQGLLTEISDKLIKKVRFMPQEQRGRMRGTDKPAYLRDAHTKRYEKKTSLRRTAKKCESKEAGNNHTEILSHYHVSLGW